MHRNAVTMPAMSTTAEDRFAIHDLLVRYATALDTSDWELFRRVWAPDCLVHYPGDVELRGYEQVRDYCAKALARYRVTQHLLGNFVSEVAGDSARATVSLQATHVPPEGQGRIFTLWGVYQDELTRTHEGWRIAQRTLTTTMTRRG